MKKSFVLHLDALSILNKMSDELAGKFIKIIYQYQVDGVIPEMDFGLDMAVTPFINQFIRDKNKYESVSEKRKEAGAKGGKQKVANATNCKQKLANVADSDSDSEKDNEKDSDIENMPPSSLTYEQYSEMTKKLTFDECKMQYFYQQRWVMAKESLMISLNIDEIKLKHLCNQFISFRTKQGDTKKSMVDFAKHFSNWATNGKRLASNNDTSEIKGNGLTAEQNREIFGRP